MTRPGGSPLSAWWTRACLIACALELFVVAWSPRLFSPTAAHAPYYLAYAFTFLWAIVLGLAAAGVLTAIALVAPPAAGVVIDAIPMSAVFAGAAAWSYAIARAGGAPLADPRISGTAVIALLAVSVAAIVVSGSPGRRWFIATGRIVREGGVTLTMMSIVVVGAGAVWQARARAASPASQPATGAPVIVYVTLDSLARGDMSLYGYRLATTPRLGEFARTATVYEDAHSTANGTSGSVPTILTGRYPYRPRLEAGDPDTLNLLAELGTRGYERVFVQGGSISPVYNGVDHDFDTVIRAGLGWRLGGDWFDWSSRAGVAAWSRLVPQWIPLESVLPEPYSTAPRTGLDEPLYEEVRRWLERRSQSGGTRPLFLYMHMLRPHFPYLANEFMGRFLPLADGFADFTTQVAFVKGAYDPDEQPVVDRLRLRYDESIAKADAELGAFLDMLRTLGLYDRALIVVSADHGSSFGNGWRGYYSPRLLAAEHEVPLIVKQPGQTAGARVGGLVSTVDVMPTILDAARIPYRREDVDGVALPAAAADPGRVIYVMNMNVQSPASMALLSGTMKLVERSDGRHLFDLARDPDERSDLIAQEHAAPFEAALSRFAARVQAIRAGTPAGASPPLIRVLPGAEKRP